MTTDISKPAIDIRTVQPLSRRMKLLALALLTLHLGIVVTQVWQWAPTYDEPAHLVSGLSYWNVGSFRLYCVNPPLVKMWAAIPLSMTGVETNWTGWPSDAGSRPEFTIALRFAGDNFLIFTDGLRSGRLSLLPFTLLGAWSVFSWAREIAGNQAGVLALGMWCLSPEVLAHGSLLTPDMPAAAVGVWASYLFFRWSTHGSWQSATQVGVAGGIACLTKFTWLLLFPLWLLVSIAIVLSAETGKQKLRRLLQGVFLIPSLSLLVLNVGYGFEGTLQPLGSLNFVSSSLAGQHLSINNEEPPHNRFKGTMLNSVRCPLPEPVLRGIDQQKRDFEICRRNYLAGTWSQTGWWYFYVYGFLVKSPIGFLGLFFLATLRLTSVRRIDGRGTGQCLITAAMILLLVSSQTGMSLHFRYVLPAFGLLFVAVSASLLGNDSQTGRKWNYTIWLFLAVAGLETIAVAPHLLSFANWIAGGPSRCHEYLADSSSDWGQDLYALRAWQKQHPECDRLFLACPYVLDPRLAGIQYEAPPILLNDAGLSTDHGIEGLVPGWYAVSTNLLSGLEYPIWNGEGGGSTARGRGLELLNTLTPTDRAGWSIRIFQIDRKSHEPPGSIDKIATVPSELE